MTYVCGNCGNEQDTLPRCEKCGDPRVVYISAIAATFGPAWREHCFPRCYCRGEIEGPAVHTPHHCTSGITLPEEPAPCQHCECNHQPVGGYAADEGACTCARIGGSRIWPTLHDYEPRNAQ